MNKKENGSIESNLQTQARQLAEYSINLKQLHRITTSHYDIIDDLINDYLETGLKIFRMTTGIVSQIKGRDYIVTSTRSDLDFLKPGLKFDLGDTYCKVVVDQNKTIAFKSAARIKLEKMHPIEPNELFESYISAPIYLKGKIYGTLNFSSKESRDNDFQMYEYETIDLMAESIGSFLTLKQAEDERLLALKQLKESEIRNRTIIDTAVDVIITIDSNGYIESVNKAFEEVFQYKPGEVTGKNVSLLMPDPYRDIHDRYIRNYFLSGIPKIIGSGREIVAQKKDGTIFPIELSISEMRFGDESKFTGIIRDITERKNAVDRIEKQNEELNRKNEELRSLDQMKDNFISTVSHELRTPLTSIKGSIGLLLNESVGKIDVEGKEFLDICYRNTDRLIRLINDLLDLSKLESMDIKLKMTEFDLKDLINDVINELEPFAGKHNAELNSEIIKRTLLNADRDRINQVLINLFSNGIKFSEGGKVSVSSKSSENRLFIIVSDTGKPIPVNMKDKIFEKFVQVDNSLTRKVGGTGLGLSISRKIVEQHGGELWLETDNSGNNFIFTLPV